MKRLLTLFMLCCLIYFQGLSQNLSPTVVSAQGGIDDNGIISLEWTLGESFIETVTHGDNIITQGFHQPLLKKEIEIKPVSNFASEFEISVGPNPVYSWLNIYLNGDKGERLNIGLYNVYGMTIINKTAFINDEHVILNLIDLSSGIYLLQISDSTGSILETIKILKIN